MTPSDFETRARGAADKYFGVKYIGLNPQGQPRYEADRPGVLTWNASQRPVFLAGAQWSRTETIAEIVGMLAEYREAYSEEIFPPRDMSKLDPMVRTVTAGYMGRHVLDTLIRQLKEGK